jgi:hypothetical protein
VAVTEKKKKKKRESDATTCPWLSVLLSLSLN